MANNRFKSIALDQLIDEISQDVLETENDIKQYDQNDIAPATNPAISNLVDQKSAGSTVDFKRVYAQLERLIENGNIALETLNALDIDVLSIETIAATTSLINAIKNCMSEFTKIHLNHIKFMQKLQLMEKEQQQKIQIIKMKNTLNNKNNEMQDNNVQMIEVGADSLLQFMQFQKQQETKQI